MSATIGSAVSELVNKLGSFTMCKGHKESSNEKKVFTSEWTLVNLFRFVLVSVLKSTTLFLEYNYAHFVVCFFDPS